MNRFVLSFILLSACHKASPVVSPPNDETVMDAPMCVAIDSCNASAELTGLIQSLIPPSVAGKDGVDGKNGTDGVSPSVQSVVDEVLTVLPSPQKGDVGPTGPGLSLTDVVNVVLPLIPPPLQGEQGPPGQSIVGPTGPAGKDGALAATRISKVISSAINELDDKVLNCDVDYNGTYKSGDFTLS